MTESEEVGMRELPTVVRSKLYRRQGLRPDMTIGTGPTDAVVVFHTQGEVHSAYFRMSTNGNEPVTRVIIEPTPAAVTKRVLGIIFTSGSRQV